jgi:heavy metal translocating P-type ATPase
LSDHEASGRCRLCGQRLAATAVETDDGDAFCGTGCRDIHVTLGENGAEASAEPERSAPTPADSGVDSSLERTFFRVDGMYSATCEAFLESVAEARDGVADAEASYITETVRVDHDPDVISPSSLEDALTTLGYTAYRRSDAEAPDDESGGTSRRARELHGVRKRRDETFLGLRYAAGILFGAFLLIPYISVIYPAHLATVIEWGPIEQFSGAFQPGDGGFQFLRVYLVMTGIVLFFTGMPVLRGAYVSLRMRRPTTDVLVVLAALGAFVYSTLAIVLGRIDVYYDLTIVIAASVTAAAFYESSIKKRALNRLTDLTVSQVDTARLYGPDGTTEVPVEEIAAGDDVIVREGERVPIGGTLRGGECVVNEAVVTGESLPVTKHDGDEIVAGSVLTDGGAVIRADERPVGGIDRLTAAIWDLQSADHGGHRYADRLAARLVPLLVGIAVVLGGASALGSGAVEGVLAALLALFVLSPWAIGLAVPLSVATSLETALDREIVVFDETVFERLRGIDVVVFDKTGTLTTGEMDVVESDASQSLLDAAVALERRAAHPVARAVVGAFESSTETDATQRGDGDRADERVRSFESHGTGVEGVVDGERTLVGTLDLFVERDWSVDAELQRRARTARESGRIPVVLGKEGAAEGIVVVGDTPRAEWRETVTRLADRGIEIVVLTGDNDDAAEFLCDHEGITHVFAEVTPPAKAEAVRRLGADRRVAMVGDGTNDAMALAVADLGLSLGSGTAMAADAADVAILDDDIRSVEAAFDLARAAKRRLEQNIALAATYNVIVVPLALAGLLSPVFTMGAVVLAGGVLGVNSTRELRPPDEHESGARDENA